MFEDVALAPPDPILGLTEAFNADPNPQKINLSVGIYQDDRGVTPVLGTVKQAERRLVEAGGSKAYKPIAGDPAFGLHVRELSFGAGHELVTDGRAVTAHTPGGTGALRIAGDYLKKLHGAPALWVSAPTWANHQSVFESAGLAVRTYPYFDSAKNRLDFDAMRIALGRVAAGDVVLLHGGCHNPTGVDPSPEQWKEIAAALVERRALPLIDFAYQGFASGVEEDAAGVRSVAGACPELVVCSSFSKNFGLYSERVGALTFVTGDAASAARVLSQVKICIRTAYSNPPAHGAAIVSTVLGDPALKRQWIGEVAEMRERIHAMRALFVRTLAEHGAQRDFSFITRQNGMFSFSGLSNEQVKALREKHAIYMVGSGRINVAGITSSNVGRLCEAIVSVL